MQRPEKRPEVKRPEPRRVSSDDLTAVMNADAAEARARAALKIAEDAQIERDASEKYNRELEKQLKAIASAPVKVEDTKSMRPGVLRLGGKDWKVAIPFTVLLAAAPYLWTVVQRVQGVLQELKDLNAMVASFQKAEDAQNDLIAKIASENVMLKTTVARQAGYLAGALPLAGVSVPGAELGAIDVEIDHDQVPLNATRRPKVVTHTRIPAPSPGN